MDRRRTVIEGLGAVVAALALIWVFDAVLPASGYGWVDNVVGPLLALVIVVAALLGLRRAVPPRRGPSDRRGTPHR